jgi:hypothetical protein
MLQIESFSSRAGDSPPELSNDVPNSMDSLLFAPEPTLRPPLMFAVRLPGTAVQACNSAKGKFAVSESSAAPDGSTCFWRLDLVSPSTETCASDEPSTYAPGACFAVPTLYFFAASADGWLTSVRYRLNAMSGPLGSGLHILRLNAGNWFKSHGLSLPPDAASAIEAGTPIKWTLGGVDYTFRAEAGPSPRFDLIAGLPPVGEDSDPQVERHCDSTACNYVLQFP